MAYTPTTYVDGSAPPLSAANLNKSETAIANIDGRVTTLENVGSARAVAGPTLPTLTAGTEYVWNKTDGAGHLVDIITGVA